MDGGGADAFALHGVRTGRHELPVAHMASAHPALDGNPGDLTGVVEFEAVYRSTWRNKIQHERSVFEYRANRWMYVSAETL